MTTHAQGDRYLDKYTPAELIENGDTVYAVKLEGVTITNRPLFLDIEQQRKYWKYKNYAQVALPYAKEAIRYYRELEQKQIGFSKKERRRYIKSLDDSLRIKFEEPIKNLTVTQGLLLTKMIEKELDLSMYDLLKDIKNGVTAFYWNQLGKLNGYHLKEGYVRGKDPIMDIVLDEIDLKYPRPDSSKKQ